jgi:hypothetical protein
MRKRVAAMLVSWSLPLLMALTVTPADASDFEWLQYSDRSTNLCMYVPGTADSVFLQEATCKVPVGSGSADQMFKFSPLSNGNTLIIAQNSNKCLRVVDSPLPEGAGIQQWTCSSEQQWQAFVVSTNPNGSANLMFRWVASQKCITGRTSGAVLYQSTCDTLNLHQLWHQHLRESTCRTCLPQLASHTQRTGQIHRP